MTSQINMPSDKDIHALLKLSTAPIHRRLEEVNFLSGPNPSYEDYVKFITATYQILVPLEKKLNTIFLENPEIHFQMKNKSPLLLSDLNSCGVSLSQLSFSSFLPEVSSVAQAFGALYVIEGSALGGQFLTKKLTSLYGSRLENSLSYLRGEGLKTFPLWKEFLGKLENYCGENEERKSLVVQSAIKTFECFEKQFLQV